MKYILSFFIVSFLFVAFAQFANAANYTSTVYVEETATSIIAAKKEALIKSEIMAFEKILLKIIPNRASEIMAFVTAERVKTLIVGFKIKKERKFAGRYLATIKYVFDKKLVDILLKNTNGLSPHTGSGTILLLPVIKNGERLVLWEDDNIWKKIVSRHALSKGRGKVLVPYGDPKDTNLIKLEQILSGETTAMRKIAIRYGSRNVAILMAKWNKDQISPDDESEDAPPQNTLTVLVRRAGAVTEEAKLTYKGDKGDDIEALMDKAASDIVKKMSHTSSQHDFFRPKDTNNSKVKVMRVEYSSARRWRDTRRAISDLPGVIYTDIIAISDDYAQITMYFKGTELAIKKILMTRGLEVIEKDKYWIVKLR